MTVLGTISVNHSGKPLYNLEGKGSNGVKADTIVTKEYSDNANIVTLTAAATITSVLHSGKTMLLSLAAGFQASLPAATGSGDVYRFNVGIVRTSNSYIIAANGTDIMTGVVFMVYTDTNDNAEGFAIGGTDDKLTLNATTTGGLTIGDTITCVDAQDGVWHVSGLLTGSGDLATPGGAT